MPLTPLDWLWPAVCAGCGEVGVGRLCRACTPAAPCRAPPPGLVAGVWVCAAYESGLGHAVGAAKGSADLPTTRLLARVAADLLAPMVEGAPFSALVPAPSTRANLLRRGFSGATVLADALAARTGLPVHHLFDRHGRGQRGLEAGARRRNLRGQIRCEQPAHGLVLLVDDVLTTGATAEACAIELIGAGAAAVWLAAWCAVRDSKPA